MVEGFIEKVTSSEACGWVIDHDQPEKRLTVEVYCGAEIVGFTRAEVYRRDLVDAGFGCGEYGFSVSFDPPLKNDQLADVWARAVDDKHNAFDLPRLHDAPVTQSPVLTSESSYVDTSQRPLFVLGATRSGTSAMAKGLLVATRYEGYNESHFFELLGALTLTARRFYEKRGNGTGAFANTALSVIDRSIVEDGLNELFSRISRKLFPGSYWLDKTPNVQMIRLAPRLAAIWPNARFIFMKRRALEYLASRARKFDDFEFTSSCRAWAQVMETWALVREDLGDRAIEVDQFDLARTPDFVAARVGQLLSLAPDEVSRLAKAFMENVPEKTSQIPTVLTDINELKWSNAQRALFAAVCGPQMDANGYTLTATYRVAKDEASDLVVNA